MNKLFLTILAVLLFAGSMAAAQPYENSSVVGQVPDRIVVTLKPGVAMNLEKSAAGLRAEVPAFTALTGTFAVKNLEPLYAGMTGNLADKSSRDLLERVLAVDFPAEMGLLRVRDAFAALPEVEEVRLVDICRNYGYLPNDPGLNGAQWYVRNNTLGGVDIRAVGGWNHALGDSNVVVAVVDSGVDWHHPDLGGPHPDKVNGAIWTNWTEYYGTAGVDDDANGKIDDIRGWDFVNVPGDGYPDEDDTDPDNDPMDYESHGTACAGTVAGIGNNGIGIAGTAHGCKVMALRVGWLPDGDTIGVVRMDFASQGMIYAVNNGADVINCSWGSTSYLSSAVSTATANGVVVVTAAGNDNTDIGPSYLSTHPDVISVAATAAGDVKASFSNYGTWVEVSAPGDGIYTTWYSHVSGTSGYLSVSGTSFSSPITAASIALIWSGNPGLSRSGVINALYNSCDNIDAANPGYVGLLGAGRVNLLRALGDDVHLYPDEFPTLFDAINEAAPGDSIKVANTVPISGPVSLDARGTFLLGGYSADFSTRDPLGNPSVITGNSTAAVMKFVGAVGPQTVVDGFSLQGGGGQSYSGIPYTAKYGGGMIVKDVSPTLRNLEITGCSVGTGSQLGCGGGIMLINSNSTLENLYIHGNTAIYGAGIFAYNSSPTLINCVIENNTVITDNTSYVPKGGGLHALDTDLALIDCRIDGHTDLDSGGGIYAAGYNASSSLVMSGGQVSGNTALTAGAGIYLNGGTADLFGVTIADNVKTALATFMNGGGFYVKSATVTADSLTCSGNDATIGGGGFFDTCPDASLTRSLLVGNSCSFFGAGLNYQSNSGGSITNNTFTGNSAGAFGGAGLYISSCDPAVTGNISAFNTGGVSTANGIASSTALTAVSCNDVFGNDGSGYSGFPDPTGTNGNISADPEFCDVPGGDYKIKSTSPCAPANSGGCDLIGALAVCGISPVPGETSVPLAFRVGQNFPNPFNPKTTIRFDLAKAGQTRVVIFDVAGRHVKTLLDEPLPASTHSVDWTGDDDQGRKMAAGIYFYLVTSGLDSSVGRMALVK